MDMNIKQEMIGAYGDAMALYAKLVAIHMSLKTQLPALKEEDLVDIGFLEREVADMMDAARKESGRYRDMVSKVMSARLIEEMIAEGKESVRTVRGEYASGSPDVKILPVIPKKGDDLYPVLLDSLGITVLEDVDPNLVSLSFTRISKICMARASEGLDPLPGLKGTYSNYVVTYRRLKGKKGEPLA